MVAPVQVEEGCRLSGDPPAKNILLFDHKMEHVGAEFKMDLTEENCQGVKKQLRHVPLYSTGNAYASCVTSVDLIIAENHFRHTPVPNSDMNND